MKSTQCESSKAPPAAWASQSRRKETLCGRPGMRYSESLGSEYLPVSVPGKKISFATKKEDAEACLTYNNQTGAGSICRFALFHYEFHHHGQEASSRSRAAQA